jgi:nicotinamidase-related amidase
MPEPLPTTTAMRDLIEPGTVAVLCHEMQRGVVGDLAGEARPAAAVAEVGMIPILERLFTAARARNVRVIHCGAAFRADRTGSFANTPMQVRIAQADNPLLIGSEYVDPVPELWDVERDVVLHRFHGYSPFAGSELDQVLKSIGVRNVIATGVSLNRGVTGMTIEAVNYGYRVVIPTDGVVGYPAEYAAMVLEHTLDALAWLTTSDEIVAGWERMPLAP